MNYGSKFRNVFPGLRRNEVLLAIAISLVAGLSYFTLYGFHDKSLITTSGGNNVWFQGDLRRNYQNMTDNSSSSHYRVQVHPLHSLATYPLVSGLARLGVDPYLSVRTVSSCFVSIWFLTAWILFRIIGCVPSDALWFSLFGLCSSAAMFWMAVPETYVLGSISIMMCLILVGYSKHSPSPDWAFVAVNSFSLSMTVTNWMVGILATLYGNSKRRTAVITLVSLSVVTLLWGLQKYIFPAAEFFIGSRGEVAYLFLPKLDRVLTVLNAFVFHTIVSPALSVTGFNGNNWPLLSVQTSLPGSTGMLGTLASVAWAVSVAVGAWALFSLNGLFPLRAVLALSLLGQLALHTVYGEETFLYSVHFLPLLLTLVALGSLTRFRLPVVALTVFAIPLTAFNNWEQFKEANELAISPRSEMKKNINLRPHDPWPRGNGHVVLAVPGSKEIDKAYYEPGGGFSPGARTFGISIWLTDRDGNLASTSDSLDISQITQKFNWTSDSSLPEIIARSKYYDAAWKNNGLGSWRLDINTPPNSTLLPSLLFRSVGPAGGAMHDVVWNSKTLLINKRWLVTITPTPKNVYLGEEGKSDWVHVKSTSEEFTSKSGWAYARVELGDSRTWSAIVKDVSEAVEDPWFDIELNHTSVRSDLHIQVPDERFSQSLDSQIAHLMMSIVGRETRPGDPLSYPLAWQRDGAYVLVALVRAGKIDLARKLAKDFAERDFFGGFGPEADAPGLGIWALMATAEQVQLTDFYNWLWPHVKRKANFIDMMLNTKSTIHQKVVGRIVPRYIKDPDLTLVAEPPRDGLILGKMHHHRPALLSNAVSFQGLRDAIKLARKLGYTQDAERWEVTAKHLKMAWERSFRPPWSDNPLTYISALWPSWIATDAREELEEHLTKRWAKNHSGHSHTTRPPWTYFEIAEAHQWLYLGRTEKTWATLQWFWDNQSSPGLYSWWGGEGEDNLFGSWDNVRGWVSPAGVTPHYWTAAEMALLQMDMLGYIDDASRSELVIGNGVPAEWITQDMSVKGLRLNGLKVDWQWQDRIMTIRIKGTNRIDVKLGASFPKSAKVKIFYLDS